MEYILIADLLTDSISSSSSVQPQQFTPSTPTSVNLLFLHFDLLSTYMPFPFKGIFLREIGYVSIDSLLRYVIVGAFGRWGHS